MNSAALAEQQMPLLTTITQEQKERTLALASYLIYLANQPSGGKVIGASLMKLVGLLFYFQAFSLLNSGQEQDDKENEMVDGLLTESFYAGKHGPMLQSMLETFAKDYGISPIPSHHGICNAPISEYDKEILKRVWNQHEDISGEMLFTGLTQDDTPWRRIEKDFQSEIYSQKFVPIPNSFIKNYAIKEEEQAGNFPAPEPSN